VQDETLSALLSKSQFIHHILLTNIYSRVMFNS
jgi:hypothetical protein